MNKIVYVPAIFVAVGKVKKVKVPTGEKKQGFFGGEKNVTRKERQWVQTGWSDCEIDGKRLADDVAVVVNNLNKEGYEVSTIAPVTSGSYNREYHVTEGGYENKGYGGYGYGYGYSFTNGFIITARKMG